MYQAPSKSEPCGGVLEWGITPHPDKDFQCSPCYAGSRSWIEELQNQVIICLSVCVYVWVVNRGCFVYYLQRRSPESVGISRFSRITQMKTCRCCLTLHNPDWYSRDEPLGLLLLHFDLRNCDEAEATFYIRHRFYRWVPNPNCHVLFTPFSSFLRSTSALYHTSSVILRAAQFRGGSVIYRGRVFFPPHCWLKMTFMGHPDKAILPAAQTGSLKRFSYSCLFTLFWDSGILLWTAASALARQEELSLTRAPWHPLETSASVVPDS